LPGLAAALLWQIWINLRKQEHKMSELRSLVFSLPKAELHVHAEACIEPELLLRIAQRNGIALPYKSIDEIRDAYDWPDLASFLDRYYRHIEVLRSELDYQELVESYLEKVSQQGVRHVEMFFDPQAHTRRGIPISTVVNGLLAGLETGASKYGISGALLACFLRELGVEAALNSLEELRRAPGGDKVIGIGLDSIENGYPPSMFKPLFDKADELGLYKVVHAGEDAPGTYVGMALALNVHRVDHGVRSSEEPAVVAELVRRGTPLTSCPLANLRCGIYAKMDDSPVADLLRKGVKMTLNSDGPAYFGGYIADNWAVVQETFDLSKDELVRLARNSVDASFASTARKAEIHEQLDRAIAA
jgi:adenosine deaminase